MGDGSEGDGPSVPFWLVGFSGCLAGPVTDWWVYEDHRSGTLIGNAAAGLPPGAVEPGPSGFRTCGPAATR